jgi:hypothetical protein
MTFNLFSIQGCPATEDHSREIIPNNINIDDGEYSSKINAKLAGINAMLFGQHFH